MTGTGDAPRLLCPFDKKPCIEKRCAVWSARYDCCSFAIPGRSGGESRDQPRPADRQESGGSGYRVHLFD